MDGRKRYRFTVAWGEEREYDDTEAGVVKKAIIRRRPRPISDLLPRSPALIEPTRRTFRHQGYRASGL